LLILLLLLLLLLRMLLVRGRIFGVLVTIVCCGGHLVGNCCRLLGLLGPRLLNVVVNMRSVRLGLNVREKSN
jgi:hypothetical protein